MALNLVVTSLLSHTSHILHNHYCPLTLVSPSVKISGILAAPRHARIRNSFLSRNTFLRTATLYWQYDTLSLFSAELGSMHREIMANYCRGLNAWKMWNAIRHIFLVLCSYLSVFVRKYVTNISKSWVSLVQFFVQVTVQTLLVTVRSVNFFFFFRVKYFFSKVGNNPELFETKIFQDVRRWFFRFSESDYSRTLWKLGYTC